MCGACCKSIQVVLDAKGGDGLFQEEVDAFPYAAKEDGSCEKLTEQECSVYHERPDICNIETLRQRHYSDMDHKQYLNMRVASCGVLINRLGMSPSLKPQYLT